MARNLVDEVIARLGQSSERGMRMSQAAAARAGVNPTDMQCLQLLQRGPMPAGELARLAGLTTASTTALLDRLERAGYVTRTRDAGDRRRVIVALDPQTTRAEIAPLYAPLIRSWRRTLAGYSDRDLAVIVRFLDEVVEAFDQQIERP
ncbi:MarR family transcriptional regulator [Asanoa sp. WMMD1127]|uniref:MarR family winged helix-turn-helix transcriptional regulator n=1 Tax=Asanoa sp. WMMD1127 TaxID=3016107 RepID=UPI002415D441|nr:MarR family transcriptional regulator [Asanoa sp. WMMD1127]MDG4821687.1 MarR family transcriptional regulator [Asanoa sp. WMMD1127]